ncbi:MAG TPA: hypothetical protein VHH72_11490 [Solirubrobacterales bacterium]|nr:hypothetical protein [Solirubrobacterales bacterium]
MPAISKIVPRRGSRPLRPDRGTLALAAIALATAGTVIGAEVVRMARRRRESEQAETPETLLGVAGTATRDTVAVAVEGYEEAPRHERILFNILNGFVGAFALMRLSTWGQRAGWWPIHPVTFKGRHIHHFVPGILIAFGAGGAGLATSNERLEEGLSFVFGAGVGLTFDEAALLLDLRDVYWTREGIVSLQVSFGLTAVLAATLLGLRILRRGEERGVEEGLIPGLEADTHAQVMTGSLR